ncbi:MAG TPA: Na(+)-translocating NADH-quinone reductase subunit A, partial [Candidatus Hydrogenedentes bacterium]|nr:Na(+)-translocating NADH-quinone reductase subunit A [Candidatus Hydrogenedentota bacterium]
TGQPEQNIGDSAHVKHVAIAALDYVGMRPTMRVNVGDEVTRGTVLFEDKKTPRVVYTAPGGGKVAAIHRGAKRALQSVVVALSERELSGEADGLEFASFKDKDPAGLNADEVKDLLLESGLWTGFRTRPYSKVANPETTPHSIFVTAMDTNPLAPSPDVVYEGNKEAFQKGLTCLTRLTEGNIYLCKAAGSKIDAGTYSGITVEEFEGPHPAGNVGTHIHFLDPVHRDKTVWHVGYQDVIAMGKLFATGQLDVTRVVSLAGPAVKRPRLLRTRVGASIHELVNGELEEGDQRIIAGSVHNGRAVTDEAMAYLGPFHQSITCIPEGRERVFLGWLAPGFDTFSIVNAFASCFDRSRTFDFTTALHGGPRAIVPIGVYEKVMPLDILPTFLLRSLIGGDLERAEELGCLELDEEDLALCTFVCPSKIDYGPVLREKLTQIEKEG